MAFFVQGPQTFGSQFGKGLGAGLASSLPDTVNQFIAKKRYEREQSQLQDLFQELGEGATVEDKMKALYTSKLSPERQKLGLDLLKREGAAAFAEKFADGNYGLKDLIQGTALGYIAPGEGQILLNDFLNRKAYEELTGGPERVSVTEDVEVEESPVKRAGEKPRTTKLGDMTDDELSALVARGGPSGKAAEKVIAQRQKLSETSQKEREFGHKQSEKFAEELRTSSENARDVIQARNEVKRIADTGITGVNARNVLQQFLSNNFPWLAPALINKDRQSLISATKSLAGGFRQLFGSRPTQAEFFWYENILPNILKDADTNVAAADYMAKVAEFNLKRQEIADEIVEENGGYRPIDLAERVRKQVKPELDAIVEEGRKLSRADKEKTEFSEKGRLKIYDKKTGKLLGDIDESEKELVDLKEYVIR